MIEGNLACVAGVKRGRGNLGARERVGRAREKEKESVPLLPPPSRVVSRPNSLPLPFRTPATQAKASVSQRHAFIREFPPRGTNAPHYFLMTVNSLSKKVAFGTGPDCPS